MGKDGQHLVTEYGNGDSKNQSYSILKANEELISEEYIEKFEGVIHINQMLR